MTDQHTKVPVRFRNHSDDSHRVSASLHHAIQPECREQYVEWHKIRRSMNEQSTSYRPLARTHQYRGTGLTFCTPNRKNIPEYQDILASESGDHGELPVQTFALEV